jgi:hypothetical protein
METVGGILGTVAWSAVFREVSLESPVWRQCGVSGRRVWEGWEAGNHRKDRGLR